jgi:hypothetical protein
VCPGGYFTSNLCDLEGFDLGQRDSPIEGLRKLVVIGD